MCVLPKPKAMNERKKEKEGKKEGRDGRGGRLSRLLVEYTKIFSLINAKI